VLAGDPGRTVRQVGMVDADGNVDAYTGSETIRYAGHYVGSGYTIQANMMLTDTVPTAMATAYEAAAGPLVLRLVAALKAAQSEGGDFRGQQSAALKIVSGQRAATPWEGVLFDVRVDDHPDPVGELERICRRFLAYSYIDKADHAAQQGDFETAMRVFGEAMALDPNEEQLQLWFPLTLADEYARFDLAEPVLKELFAQNAMWSECVLRYAQARPLTTEGLLEKILKLAPDNRADTSA
jgi:uncharacterized Ntn-hydrolase superfamily protein